MKIYTHSRSCLYSLYLVKDMSALLTRVIGCTCFVWELTFGLDKLSPRPIKCLSVGYSRIQKGFRCYNLVSRKYFVYVDVFKLDPYFASSLSIGQLLLYLSMSLLVSSIGDQKVLSPKQLLVFSCYSKVRPPSLQRAIPSSPVILLYSSVIFITL